MLPLGRRSPNSPHAVQSQSAAKASRKAGRRVQGGEAARKAAVPAQQDDATRASAAMGLQEMAVWTSPRAVDNALLSV
jgi:hypothetical protein